MIPNNIYFVFGFKKQIEEFLFCYYLSILSAKLVNNPDNIFFYYHYEPHGKWWDKIKSLIILKKIEIPTHIGKKKILNYANAADKARLQVLYHYGGIYMDMDTISVKPYSKLLNNECVMGLQESPIGLCNAIIMCEPKSKFIKLWIDNSEKYFVPNGWDEVSVRLPLKLYLKNKNKNIVTVLNKDHFFYPNWNKTELIFEKENSINPKLITLHLWETMSMKYLKNIKNYSWFTENSHTLYGKIGLELIKKYDIEHDGSNINDKMSNKCIPKIIHQTWKTKEIPEKMKFCVNSWKILNPNYKYMFWTDEDIDIFINEKYPEYKSTFLKLKYGIQKAGILRILVLHYYGGTYADIDFECLIPIDEWNLNHNKINAANEPIYHHSTDILCDALISCKPHLDILVTYLNYGCKIINKNPNEIMKSFGPIGFNTVMKDNQEFLNIIDRKLLYPIPDITIKSNLEKKYKDLVINRNFGNSWAVHYWEHSNWPRTNILNKYYKYLVPKIKLKSINICGIYRNNEVYLKKYFIPKMNRLELLYPYIKFHYYFYENDSTDATEELLSEFSINRKCKFLTEKKQTKLFSRNTDKNRIENIINCRNRLLSLRPFEGEWTMMIDSDIEFPDDLISRFICKDLPKDLVALSCNGKDNKKCKLHKNCYHYYDTLALVYKNNTSGFKYFQKNGFQCCPFNNKVEIDSWINNDLIRVLCSFGGLCFYKTDIINKTDITHYLEQSSDLNIYIDHLGFSKTLAKYGNTYIDPTFIVRNTEL